MFANYFKIAWRNLLKTKFFSLINILGLCLGMVACLLIVHYINFEKSFDNFHDHSERIYRLRYEREAHGGTHVRFASGCPPAAPLLKARYPEIEYIARLYRYPATVSFGEKKFSEEKMFFAESEIFSVLNFNFLKGDIKTVLNQANTAVISRETARKYFGNESAMGKTLSVNKKNDYVITGVFEDFPANSHIKCHILLAYQNLITLKGPQLQQAWGYTGFFTYLLLKEGANPQELAAKFPALIEEHAGPLMQAHGVIIKLVLQPLRDIHLNSHFMQELEANGSQATLRYLAIIAIFIIIMAWVNYINLSTARSLSRAREVGIRKVVGASRQQLVLQFFFETVLLNSISILLAILLSEALLPAFAELTNLPTDLHLLQQTYFWQYILILFGAGVLLAGFYPVILLSSYQPHKVLKGKLGNSAKGINLRRALVLFQFAIALILIAGTVTVFQQINFMREQDLGFKMNQSLVVKAPRVVSGAPEEKNETFKNEVRQLAGVAKTCFATEVPGRQIFWDAGGIHKAGTDLSTGKNYLIVGVDYHFVDLFELEFACGRNFSPEFPADKEAVLFNEKAVEWMGFASPEEAVGQDINYWGNIYRIIGVLKNYHQQSLKEAFEPHIYRFVLTKSWGGVFAIKIHGANIRETVAQVQEIWETVFPGNPFDFFFLDDYFNQQYQADELFGRVFGLFALLAIIVSSLGILGLSAFSVTQRTKEIGIRKVLGAGILRIAYLLTRDFFLLLLVAYVISIPLIFSGANWWLTNFANRMNPGGLLFVLPLLIVWLITFVTVSFQTVKAASANPVESLRYE